MSFFKKAKIEVLKNELVYAGWNRMHRLEVDYTGSNGDTVHLVREVVDHGSAAAILLFNPTRETVVLVRQYRTGADFAGKEPFVLEIPAGLTDGDAADEAAKREALEETGYRVEKILPILSCFPSPGALSEEVHLYAGLVDASHRIENGGGLDHEHEDIEVVELSLPDAYSMIGTGEIIDAKTIIALQWVMLNRAKFQKL